MAVQMDQSLLNNIKYKAFTVIDSVDDRQQFQQIITDFLQNGSVEQLVASLKNIITRPARLQLFDDVRRIVPTGSQMEYNMLTPYTFNKVRQLRLIRRGSASFGFTVRGGKEHGIGIFVSEVEAGTEAHLQGLKVGDQILRINGFSVEHAIHQEVTNIIRSKNHLNLKVRSTGMIPVKEVEFQMPKDDTPPLPEQPQAVRKQSVPAMHLNVGHEVMGDAAGAGPCDDPSYGKSEDAGVASSGKPGNNTAYGQKPKVRPQRSLSEDHLLKQDRSKKDPLTWKLVEDVDASTAHGVLEKQLSNGSVRSSSRTGSRTDECMETKLFINMAGDTGLGCCVCKGPAGKPGIFVQSTKEGCLAREAGLRPGDQILECNGVSFGNIEFADAVFHLKSSKQIDLLLRKGAGVDLFPGESSGYNSSASSVNEDQSDQSPVCDDKKRLSVVKEESQDLSDGKQVNLKGHAAIDRCKEWDDIENEWVRAEKVDEARRREAQKKKEENDKRIEEEKRREKDQLKFREQKELEEARRLLELKRKEAEEARAQREKELEWQRREEQKLREERRKIEEEQRRLKEEAEKLEMEKKRLEEEKKTLQKTPSVNSSNSSNSSLASAISQELQRRLGRSEREEEFSSGDSARSEGEKQKDILKLPDPKREQHVQLMEEFRRAHRKMFAVNQEENSQEQSVSQSRSPDRVMMYQNTLPTVPMPGAPSLNVAEERQSFKQKLLQKEEEQSKKVADQKGVGTVWEQQVVSNSTELETQKTGRAVEWKFKNGSSQPSVPPPKEDRGIGTAAYKPKPPVLLSPVTSTSQCPPCPSPDYDSTPNQTPPTTIKPAKLPPRGIGTLIEKVTDSSSSVTSRDSTETGSLESFTITDFEPPIPKPPPIYFETGKVQKKPGSVLVSISSYPSPSSRPPPSRFDFLPNSVAENKFDDTSKDYRSDLNQVSSQLQSELQQTLSRSNLRQRAASVDNILSETASSGLVTVSVNNGVNTNDAVPSQKHTNKTSNVLSLSAKYAALTSQLQNSPSFRPNINASTSSKDSCITNSSDNRVTISLKSEGTTGNTKSAHMNGILKSSNGSNAPPS